MFSSILVSFGLLAAGGVLARPTAFAPATRDVVAPPITYPTASTVWTVGEKTHVDWDASQLPPYDHITNPKAMVVLGYLDPCSDGEHLDLDHPLAKDFNITLGTIPVTVPNVVARSDYVLVLFGDSGNLSPKFTINVAISGEDGQMPPVRAVCTTSTSSSSSSVSTSATSKPSSLPSSSPSPSTSSSSASDASSDASSTTDTTIVIVPTSTLSGASATSTGALTASSLASPPASGSGSLSAPSKAPSSSSAHSPTASSPGAAAQSQSTNGAATVTFSRLTAALGGFAAAAFLVL